MRMCVEVPCRDMAVPVCVLGSSLQLRTQAARVPGQSQRSTGINFQVAQLWLARAQCCAGLTSHSINSTQVWEKHRPPQRQGDVIDLYVVLIHSELASAIRLQELIPSYSISGHCRRVEAHGTTTSSRRAMLGLT